MNLLELDKRDWNEYDTCNWVGQVKIGMATILQGLAYGTWIDVKQLGQACWDWDGYDTT